MKKLTALVISLLLILSFPLIAAAQGKPSVVAQSAILIDNQSGQVLYDKEMNVHRYPASTTKILTTIIAIENGKLSDIVTASKNAAETEGSSIWLKEGEKHTLEDLLYGIMLNSANDACVAVAEHQAGSVEKFAELMNKKAREIGAKNSHFVNPNGLPNNDHYTTAYDLAMIAHYAMQNPTFRKIVSTKTKDIPWEGNEWERRLINHNKMLWRYQGANGVKTGYTKVAQQCLVTSARRGDREFLAVILSSQGQNIWSDARALLDYGFANYNTVKVVDMGKEIKTLKVSGGGQNSLPIVTSKALYHTVPLGTVVKPVSQVKLPQEIKAPVSKGQKVGEVVYYQGDKEVGRVNLIAAKAIQAKKEIITPKKTFSFFGLVLAGGLVLFFVQQRVSRRRRKQTLFAKSRYRRNRW